MVRLAVSAPPPPPPEQQQQQHHINHTNIVNSSNLNNNNNSSSNNNSSTINNNNTNNSNSNSGGNNGNITAVAQSNSDGSNNPPIIQQQQQQQNNNTIATAGNACATNQILPPPLPQQQQQQQLQSHHQQQPHQQQQQQSQIPIHQPPHLAGPMNHHHPHQHQHHMHLHHHHHHPHQQPVQHNQHHHHENGHGNGNVSAGGNGNVSNIINSNGGGGMNGNGLGVGGGVGVGGGGVNNNNNNCPQQQQPPPQPAPLTGGPPNTSAPPPPPASAGGLYIPYTGEFYPAEHGYYIPHPHEMCPTHHPAAICGMPSEYGPTTVQMVSQNRPPPIPVPVQVPQGQVMQQYVNESGTLTHVVLSPTQYQQLHTGQGGVPHIHAPFITTNGTASHFYGPLPGGFPGPGGGPHFHPMPGGHLPPQQMSHSPHSPSPPNNYHKDERTQRQHTKLLRKLDQKREMNSALSTPAHSPSPRKNELNGIRKTSRNGASSVGTSEDGEESSSVPDEEDDCQTIIEQLSAVQKPEVTDILSRSAMVRWKAPPTTENLINSRDLRYDVLLSDRGKEGKYKKILEYGESYMCMIRDLRPGQEYFVCVQVHHEKLVGCASEPTVFVTPPCEPDQPSPPKLIARTKYSLQLRWNAPTDNGSHISNYILEYDEGKGNEFTEIVKTKGKQYTITKLEPSTQYCFRLAAVNECGPSIYSEVVSFSTSGNPPPAPKPPKLKKATSNSLLLTWEKRAQDERFVLKSYYDAFASIKYDGPDTSYEVIDLNRACSYEFKLRADNEFGSSPWSDRVTFTTAPDRPGKPSKPQVKGKIHATQVKVTWNPPEDKGGDSFIIYILEISSGRKFEKRYTGHETEAICTRLSPGTTYQIRVASKNAGGVSDYSDICTVTTEILLPGQLLPPYCGQPLTPYDVLIRWDAVPVNFKSEGTSISHFDVKVNGPNFTDTIVFSGKRQDCVIKDLLPGEKYSACVRGVNRLGAGPWSVPFRFSSGASIPSAPEIPEVIVCSATHVTVTWKEPNTNGAPIIEYQLERLVSNTDNGSAIDDTFYTCYRGIHTTADIQNLRPFTNYCFRVCALNSAGTSPYSPIVLAKTLASVPSAPQMQNYEITATEVTLHWSQPESNGPDILHYVIEYNDKSVTTEKNITDFTIKNLLPETSYKFKVQAVNEIGAGQFSNQLKLTTLPPPPKPPKLKCTGVGHNFIKLKWDDEKTLLDSKRKGDLTNYYVEMYNTSAKEFQSVYSGMNLMCKVNKLQEQTSYKFRIYCETDNAGIGDYSEEYVFKTSPTLPNSIKPPRIADTNLNMSCCCSNSTTITNTNIHQTNHNNNNTNSNSISNNSKIANGANAQNLVNNCSQNSAVIGGITGTRSATSHIHCFKNNNILTVEWQHSKNTFKDPIEYILQCSCGKENEYVEIYRGPQTRFTIDNLESGSTYLFRVCPVRITKTNGDIMGSFTPSLRYQMPPQHRTSINCIGAATSSSVAANSMLTSCTSMSNMNHRSSHNHHHYHNNHGHHHHHHRHDIGNSSCSDALLHNNDGGNDYTTLTKGTTASGTTTGILSGIVGTGTLQRYMGRLTAIYTNRKRLSDQEKAVLWMLSFILATICFASIVKMFMR